MEINTGTGVATQPITPGLTTFRSTTITNVNAGGPYPETNTFGLSAPFAQAKQPESSVYTSIPMKEVVWFNQPT